MKLVRSDSKEYHRLNINLFSIDLKPNYFLLVYFYISATIYGSGNNMGIKWSCRTVVEIGCIMFCLIYLSPVYRHRALELHSVFMNLIKVKIKKAFKSPIQLTMCIFLILPHFPLQC